MDQSVCSPQESLYELENHIPDENPTSSPRLPSKHSSGKRKQPPTVTPKRFTRFFTPRSSLENGVKISASRQVLRDITASGANHKRTERRRKQTKDSIEIFNDDYVVSSEVSKRRRRVGPISPDTTPDRSSPLKRMRKQSLDLSDNDDANAGDAASEEDLSDDGSAGKTRRNRTHLVFSHPIVYSQQRGHLGRLLRQETGDISPRYRTVDYGNIDWQNETADFMTRPEDTYACLNPADSQEATLPFCATSCNSKY